MAATEPQIRVCEVTRTYSSGDTELHALDHVSLAIERGEFVAIVGSSGSGKSTLMNIIGCLDRPTSGQYFFEGMDVAGLQEPELAHLRSQRLGFVFQTFNLLARTSAVENVALPLFYSEPGRAGRKGRMVRARASLEALGLGAREQNTPGQLSGGQQQRVAIARALINRPEVLLADEPTGNLDTRTSHEIMETLRALNRNDGVTVVLVTHEPDIAAYMDRIVTMRDGRIVSDERKAASAPDKAAGPGNHAGESRRPIAAANAPSVWLSFPFAAMIVSSAAQAIARNKMRSVLTMLGVFIGVAALIAMVAVGQGANAAVRRQIESLGTNLLVVLPGATTANGMRAGAGSASTLTTADAQAIRREDPAVVIVSYLIRQVGQVQYANQNWSTNVQGISPSYVETANWRITQGRAITADDEANAATVALIGDTVYHQLFSAYENPIGALIQVKGTPVRVVGMLASKGQSSYGQDQDDLIMIPYSTAERKVLGVAAPLQSQSSGDPYFPSISNPYGSMPRLTGYVNQIFVQAVSADQVLAASDQVNVTLARRHHIAPGTANDFAVRNLSQIAQTAESSSHIMALLLAVIASISLLVGGIGIMNILLVSVTERTREIGLRMAIGARRLHVLLQFLAEAVLLSVTGGAIGVLTGIGVAELISMLSQWPTELSTAAIVGGFLFSAIVGIFFGYYPARKASQLNPIEALRYE